MKKDCGVHPWFYPLPVLIIGSYDENGVPDAMNAAWGGLYGSDKVVLCLSAGHKTTANIKARKAFTVSFANAANLTACDYVGLVSANEEPDKFAKAGFHAAKSAHVDAPLIDELPVALECRLIKVSEDGNLIGQIVNISVDESVLNAGGRVDAARLGAIAFDPCSNSYLKMGEVVGKAFSDGARLK